MSSGRIGYEAYKASTGGKTFDGRDMPTWEQVCERTPHVAKAWEDAARAVRSGLVEGVSGPDARFPFSVAIEHLKNGRRVAREGWNGKGMWIALTPGSVIKCRDARKGAACWVAAGMAATSDDSQYDTPITIGAHIDMHAADGSLVIGWLASQTDMLEEDWVLVS